jgi:hypothetical protein
MLSEAIGVLSGRAIHEANVGNATIAVDWAALAT